MKSSFKINCKVCNKEIMTNFNSKKYCEECGEAVQRICINESQKKLYQKRKLMWNKLSEERKEQLMKQAADYYLKNFNDKEPREVLIRQMKKRKEHPYGK